ncbi:MAG: hypothetical protein IT334_08815 [Thermomicrobiales bacterium]|nr:hypothetical protein [Thermomicrobiales bacterium]
MAVSRGDTTAAEGALEEAEVQGRASLADVRRVVRLLRAGLRRILEPQPEIEIAAASLSAKRR